MKFAPKTAFGTAVLGDVSEGARFWRLLALLSFAVASQAFCEPSAIGRAPRKQHSGQLYSRTFASAPSATVHSEPLAIDVRQHVDASVRVEADTPGYVLYEVHFPSLVRSRFSANNTVWGHLYLPKNRRGREAVGLPSCILVLPMMAAPNVWIETQFMKTFVSRGNAVFWIEMPYQFHRVPASLIPSGQVFLSRTPKGLAANFRQSVLDARGAISWLEYSGRVDPKRIAVFGISLGALVGSATLSVDSRLRGGVFLLGGADFPSLVFRSDMTRRYVRKLGVSEENLRTAWKGLDPVEYRERNRGKNVVLINAWSDPVIDRRNVEALHEAFPDSRRLWVPFGHYSSILHLFWVRNYVASQLGSILGRG